MKTKFLLPGVAMLFAVGISFATVMPKAEQTLDYIRVNDSWQEIPEIECGEGPRTCEVRLADGSKHPVYDMKSFSSIKDTDRTEPFQL